MARQPTILQSEYPYHITARCINRQWFDIPIEEMWRLTTDYLYLLHHGFGFLIHAFVLMSNHYHLLASTPHANIDEGMNYFQRELSRNISKIAGRINQTWGGPYDPCVVDSFSYYMNAYKYVYRNPVEAGIVERCDEYKFGTLNGLLGQQHMIVPVENDTLLFDPKFNDDTLVWLNQAKKEDVKEVEKALRKPKFRFGKCESTNQFVREASYIF